MTSTHSHSGPSAAARAAGIIVAVTVVLAILTLAFALPAVHSGPRDVPIGIAGNADAAGRLTGMLDQNAPGAFAVTSYPDRAALTHAIENREVYGGFALPSGPAEPATLLIASGGSPAVAQLLTQLGGQLGARANLPVQTVDLAPLPDRDPRGAGLAASALPLSLAGLLPAVALLLVLPRAPWTRLAAAVVFSGVAGVTIAALLWFVFGSIDENFWGVAAGLTLGVAAALLAILGLGSLFGRPGLVIGALLAVLVGNPLSGLAGAPEMLPAGWGQFGQLLPQGATATLLRSTTAFGGAGASTAVVVLTCWALVGTALVVVAAVRDTRNNAVVT
ncbi:ABC transporter permease [Mycobacterium sp. ITM-2016-00317]|uniref:ABC transporter permease n=1 Tax=Mycobacterium sp. ITM-2016-00317 TaxID=2099694 RepID=UPI000D42B53D|nr:ABC transporter permease [Mycobacterium sp. ITM-2016-00317]WNG88194.1 ABC transporter permease [Mycobacterium sp. ITM-2016-00317]